MRKLLIGLTIVILIFSMYLLYNHKQIPTKDDVFKLTGNWSPATEEVYMVSNIDGEWLTIFRTSHSILVCRLEQNWLGYWKFKDDLGGEGSVVSTYYPPTQKIGFTWSASSVSCLLYTSPSPRD